VEQLEEKSNPWLKVVTLHSSEQAIIYPASQPASQAKKLLASFIPTIL